MMYPRMLVVIPESVAASLRKVKRSHKNPHVGQFYALDGAWDRKKVCVGVEATASRPLHLRVYLANVGRIYSSDKLRHDSFKYTCKREPGVPGYKILKTRSNAKWGWWRKPVKAAKPVAVDLYFHNGTWFNHGIGRDGYVAVEPA